VIEGNTNTVKVLYVNALVYGLPGSGKTWFVGSAPKPYIICSERLPAGLAIAGKAIPYVMIETMEDLFLVLNEIEQGKRAVGMETIILDSLTELTPLVKDYVMRIHGKKEMTLQLWGIAVDNLRMAIRKIRDIGKTRHTIVTARAVLEKDEYSGIIQALPDTIGKFAANVPGLFDWFFYCQQETQMVAGVQKVGWVMNTVGVGFYPAKDGLGVLALKEPNDFPTVYAKVLSKSVPQLADKK
jgi:hypothetical protein